MKKYILAVLFVISTVGFAFADYGVSSDPTTTGSGGTVDVYSEDTSMMSSTPTFSCDGHITMTTGGHITQIQVCMTATRFISGNVLKNGVVTTPAELKSDYLCAFRAEPSLLWITDDEIKAQCAAVAVAEHWQGKLTVSLAELIAVLPN